MSDDLENYVLRLVDRYMAGRHSKRYGLVTSWDPKTHLSKVRVQPEDVETGWIPTHTMNAGGGYGHMIGLASGDHVELTHQEGEFEGAAVTARIHSKQDPPPELDSNEHLFRTIWHSFIKLAKDGSITITDKSGDASIKLDGSGNITITAKAFTLNASAKAAINGSPVDVNS